MEVTRFRFIGEVVEENFPRTKLRVGVWKGAMEEVLAQVRTVGRPTWPRDFLPEERDEAKPQSCSI